MVPGPICIQELNRPNPLITAVAVIVTALVVVETVVDGGPVHAVAGVTEAIGVLPASTWF
jgi:hypothetical protein